MARYGNTILTSAGLDLAKRTVNGTSTFKITRVVTSGDSTLQNATIDQVLGLTSLNSIVQNGTVTAFDTSNPKQIGLKAQFVNRGLTDQYKIFAVGIYAQEAGKSEILYAVTPAVDPETMPARPSDSDASFTFTLQIYAAVANSSSVTISATTEGVVKSVNGTFKPDANGDLSLPFQSQAEANQLRDDLTRLLDSETQNRQNSDTSVLSQAKGYTDTAKSDLTTAMNKADASVLGQANAYTDFALRQVWTPTVITTAIDLNNVKACGSYFIKNMLGTTSNTPIPNAWLYVRVEGVPTRITQTVWKDINPTVQWVRVFMDNSWRNWTQITKAI